MDPEGYPYLCSTVCELHGCNKNYILIQIKQYSRTPSRAIKISSARLVLALDNCNKNTCQLQFLYFLKCGNSGEYKPKRGKCYVKFFIYLHTYDIQSNVYTILYYILVCISIY